MLDPAVTRRFVESAWDDSIVPELVDYVRTWSSVQRYTSATGADPLAIISDDLHRAWGDASARRVVRWPIPMLLGQL